MSRLVAVFLLGILPPLVDPPAASPARPAPPAAPASLKIVFWYDRSRPLETFRYQVYDVEKGEYTPAVEAWLAQMHAQFQAYAAYVREVDLARVPGDTRNHKIGSAIVAEFLAVGAEHGYDFGDFAPGRASLTRVSPPGKPAIASRPFASPGSRAFIVPDNAPPFPTPLPFPRPHP